MSTFDFFDEIDKSPIDLSSAALSLSKAIAYPQLDVDFYLELLDGLGDWVIKAVDKTKRTHTHAETISAFLFDRLRFQGNRGDYEDPRNSYINAVLDRRLGIPISLSVIYLHVARKARLQAEGIALPGHFVVRVTDPDGDVFIDPFNQGKVLTLDDCAQLVATSTGYQGPLQDDWLTPVTPAAILTRMLNNLRNIYLKLREWEAALSVIEHTRMLQPNMPELIRDLGIIYHQKGQLRLAIENYEQYLNLVPDAPDAPAVKTQLRLASQRLSRLN